MGGGRRPVANLASIWLTTSVLLVCTLAVPASASHAQPAAATHLSSQLARHISRGMAVPADSRIARLVEAEQLAVPAPADARRPLPAPVAGSMQLSAADSPFKKQQQARQMVQQRLAQQQQQKVQPLQQKQEQPQQQPQQQHQKQTQKQQTLLKQKEQQQPEQQQQQQQQQPQVPQMEQKQQPQQQQEQQEQQEQQQQQQQQQAAGSAAAPDTALAPPPTARTDALDAAKADAAAGTGSLPSQLAQASNTMAMQPDKAAEGSKQQQEEGTAAANAVNTISAGPLPGSSTAPTAAASAGAQPLQQQQQPATANAVKALINAISGGPDSSTAGAAAAPPVVQPAESQQPVVAARAQEPAPVLSGLPRAKHPEVWLLLRMPEDSMGAFAQSSLKDLDVLPEVPASADKGSTSSAAPVERPAPAPEVPANKQDSQQAVPASNTTVAGEAETMRQGVGASAEQQPSAGEPSPAPADSKNVTVTAAEQEEWVEVWVEEEEEEEAEAEAEGNSAVGANAATNATQQAPLSAAAAFLDSPSVQGGGVEPASFSSFARAKARAQAYRQHVKEEAEAKKADAQYHAAHKDEEEEALAVAAPEVPGKAQNARPYEPKVPQKSHYEHEAEEEPAEHWYYPGEADDLTADPCARPLLSPPFFDRHNSSSLNNAYVAMLLSRYAYPAALGVSGKADEARDVYQDLYRHKWEAMGALPGSIKFCDVEGSSGHGGKLMMMAGGGKKHHPDAHAVVFATASDVWVSFRGITDLDTALHSDMKAHATHVHMGGKRVAVHSSYYYAYKALWPQVAAAVKAALLATRDPARAHIFLTGHGLGAAQATFTALRLADMRLKNVGGLWLFGAPQMGQKTFVHAFKGSQLPRITHHWWNELDMVPAMGSVWPLKRHHYTPLPATTLHRIWDGQCEKADKSTARTCVDRKRCKTSSTDHKAVAYATQLQSCVLRQPAVAGNHCLADKVLNSM